MQPDPMEVHRTQERIATSLETIAGSLANIAESLMKLTPMINRMADAEEDEPEIEIPGA